MTFLQLFAYRDFLWAVFFANPTLDAGIGSLPFHPGANAYLLVLLLANFFHAIDIIIAHSGKNMRDINSFWAVRPAVVTAGTIEITHSHLLTSLAIQAMPLY